MIPSIPRSWALAPIDAVARIEMGQSPPSSAYNEYCEGLPFFQGKAEFGPMHPTPVKWCGAPTKVAEPGAVLLSVRAPVGPTNLAITRCCIGRGLAALHPLGGVDSRYLLYGLRATATALEQKATGSTFSAVRGAAVRQHLLPIAPLPEQRRIVEALETHFTRLDATEPMIASSRARLEQLESQLFTSLVCGAGVSTGWGAAALHDSWTWRRVDQLCDHITKGTTPPAHAMSRGPEGIPFLKIHHLSVRGTIRHSDRPVFISRQIHASVLARSIVHPGDVIMNIVGPPLGQVAIVPDDYPEWNINQAIARFRPRHGLLPGYLAATMRTSSVLQWFLRRAKTTSGQVNLTLATCRELPIPLPPLDVQAKLCGRFEAIDSQLGAGESSCLAAHRRCAGLRQSLLRLAFEGRLVPQDSRDEPASVLLERIRAERANAAPSPKRKPTRTRR